jgi:hypothetical protein
MRAGREGVAAEAGMECRAWFGLTLWTNRAHNDSAVRLGRLVAISFPRSENEKRTIKQSGGGEFALSVALKRSSVVGNKI